MAIKPQVEQTEPAPIELGLIEETALITLWARYIESKRTRGAFRDPKAVEIVEALPFDFEPFRKGWMTQIGVRLRTVEFDSRVASFIKQYPTATIVEIGAGLNSRHLRIGRRAKRWIDVDVAEMIELRNRFFSPQENHQFLAASILEPDWAADVRQLGEPPYLFIFEGVLMYFPPDVVADVFHRIGEQFKGSTLLLDVLGNLFVRNRHHHDLREEIKAPFLWSLQRIEEIEAIDNRLSLADANDLLQIMSKHRKDHPGLTGFAARAALRLLPVLRRVYWHATLTVN